jgi:hypothetical protein
LNPRLLLSNCEPIMMGILVEILLGRKETQSLTDYSYFSN